VVIVTLKENEMWEHLELFFMGRVKSNEEIKCGWTFYCDVNYHVVKISYIRVENSKSFTASFILDSDMLMKLSPATIDVILEDILGQFRKGD
jgi:hypothetical protein